MQDRWSNFLAERGFSMTQALGVMRAVAPPDRARRSATRCVDLNHFAALHLVGPDAATFLQGYVTCDMAQLTDVRALPGAYCNIKGRVVADLLVAMREGSPLLLVHASVQGNVTSTLQKYLNFARSRFAPSDDAPILLGLIDPPATLGVGTDAWTVTPLHSGIAIGIPGEIPRVLLALPFDDAATVWQDFESRSQTDDATSWDLLDVRARMVHINAATSEAFLPQMLDYDRHGAISFTKGCYLGQEVVARTQHLGAPKRHLHALRYVGTPPSPGTVLTRTSDERRAGTLVASASSGAGRGEALAVLSDDVSGTLAAPGVTFTPQ